MAKTLCKNINVNGFSVGFGPNFEKSNENKKTCIQVKHTLGQLLLATDEELPLIAGTQHILVRQAWI